MKDRNGIEVRVGDRVMVFDVRPKAPECLGYEVVKSTSFWCNCAKCDGKMAVEFVESFRTTSHYASSDEIELPVTAAIARSREL